VGANARAPRAKVFLLLFFQKKKFFLLESSLAGRKRTQNWDDLRHFLAVARTGTLSAAAEALGTDHTTVARHVARLEEGLTARVFYRSNLGYDLTPSGERLRPIAEAMEAGYIAAASMEREDPAVSGTIRIGAPDGFGTCFLAPRIHLLAAQHPRLEIELLATARVFSLSKREADIVISLTSPEHARVVSRRLTDYRLGLYASRAYLAAHPPITQAADLPAHDFVGYIEDMLFTPELNYLSHIGEGIVARTRSTNLIAQAHATVAGSGLCVLPYFIARDFPELAPVLPAEIALKRSFYMHIHEDNRKAAPVRAAAAFISEEVARADGFFQ
jgi:DNA-binding transcriptional LysR family regulator